MANYITGGRIILSLAMLLCPVFSKAFYILYLLAGLSDMIDGSIARRCGTQSACGARFDTAADIVFAAVCAVRMLPVLKLPVSVLLAAALVLLLKVSNIFIGLLKQKTFTAKHTVMNKISGALLFVFPFTLGHIKVQYSAAVLCAVTLFSAVQESCLILRDRE